MAKPKSVVGNFKKKSQHSGSKKVDKKEAGGFKRGAKKVVKTAGDKRAKRLERVPM